MLFDDSKQSLRLEPVNAFCKKKAIDELHAKVEGVVVAVTITRLYQVVCLGEAIEMAIKMRSTLYFSSDGCGGVLKPVAIVWRT